MEPGDAVLLQPGHYAQRVEINVSGLPDKPVTLMGVEGAVIGGMQMPAGENVITIADQSHVRIIGLEINGTNRAKGSCGIYVEGAGTGIEIRNCFLHDLRGKDAIAIGIFGTRVDAALTGITVDGNRIRDCEPAPSEALVLNGNVDGFTVTRNVITDVNNIGIDFIGGEEDIVKDAEKVARRGLCQANRVERARSSYGGGYAAGIYVDGGRGIRVVGNTVTGCDLGIEVGAENPGAKASGIVVEKNILYGNEKAGLVFGGYEEDRGRVMGCEFRGNIVYQNTSHRKAQAELWIQHAEDNVVEENVFVAPAGRPMVQVVEGGMRNRLDRNTFYSPSGAGGMVWLWGEESGRGLAGWQSTSGRDAASLWKDPRFRDPAKGDFSIAPGAVPDPSVPE